MKQNDRYEDYFFIEDKSYKERFLIGNKRKKIKRIKILLAGIIIVFAAIISIDNFIYPFLTSEAATSNGEGVADWSMNKEGQDLSDVSILETDPNQEDDLVSIDNDKEKKANKSTSSRINTNKRVTTLNPNSITALVNKQIFLPEDYEPEDLVIPNIKFSFNSYHQKKLMREEAARAIEDMFNASDEAGLSLRAVSGYRSYERQYELFIANVKRAGLERALRISAMPGCSEHQMGLAMDVSTKSVSYSLNNRFANTPEGKWLAENSYKYGYIIRYPEGKEDITGYSYESWHIRYVGTQLAKELYEKDLTLEEYYGFEINPFYYNGITYDNIAEFGIDPEDLKVKKRPVVRVQETEEESEIESEIESEETEATEKSGEAVDGTKASTPTEKASTPTEKASTQTLTPKGESKDKSKGESKDNSKDESKGESKDKSKGESKDKSKDESKDNSKDESKDNLKDKPEVPEKSEEPEEPKNTGDEDQEE